MNRIILIIFISLGFLSCTLNRNMLSGSSHLYSLHFSKITELEEMEDSRYGMGYTTDGKYLYAVNGSSVVPFYTTDIVRYDITSDEWSILTNQWTPKKYISAEYVAG